MSNRARIAVAAVLTLPICLGTYLILNLDSLSKAAFGVTGDTVDRQMLWGAVLLLAFLGVHLLLSRLLAALFKPKRP